MFLKIIKTTCLIDEVYDFLLCNMPQINKHYKNGNDFTWKLNETINLNLQMGKWTAFQLKSRASKLWLYWEERHFLYRVQTNYYTSEFLNVRPLKNQIITRPLFPGIRFQFVKQSLVIFHGSIFPASVS